MEELLAVTDAAVKALNKSTRSLFSTGGSHSSKRSTIREEIEGDNPISKDSGITKTKTDGAQNLESDSDVSTTASDVLIRSTIADPDERSFQDIGRDEVASNVSKCSRASIGSENFNTSGSYKVRISTKKLREIKSPFESPRDIQIENHTTQLSSQQQNIKSQLAFKNNYVGDENLGSSSMDKEMPGKKLDTLRKSKENPFNGTHINQTIKVSAIRHVSPREVEVKRTSRPTSAGSDKIQKNKSGPSSIASEDSQKPKSRPTSACSQTSSRASTACSGASSRPSSAPRGLTEIENAKKKSATQNTRSYDSESIYTVSSQNSTPRHFPTKTTNDAHSPRRDLRGVEFSPSDKSAGGSPGVYVQKHTPRKKIHPEERKKLFIEDECYESGSGSELGHQKKGEINTSLDMVPQKESTG